MAGHRGFDAPAVVREDRARKLDAEEENTKMAVPLMRAELGPDADTVSVAMKGAEQGEETGGVFREARAVRIVDGRTFVVDAGHHRILEVKGGAARVLVAGEGRDDGEDLLRPNDVLPCGDVLVLLDTGRCRLTACTGLQSGKLSEPKLLLQPGGPRGKSSPEGLKFPRSVAATPRAIYIADSWSHRLLRMNRPDFADLSAAAEQLAASMKPVLGGGMPGAGLSQLRFPTDVVVVSEGSEDGIGEVLLVSDSGNHRVLRVTYNGPDLEPDVEMLCGTGSAGIAPHELASPSGLARLADGTLFVADTDNRRVQRFAPGAKDAVTVCSSPAPWGLAVDGARLLVTDLLGDTLLSKEVA